MQRNLNFSIGEYYHIYNRGTDKRVIFMDHHDYQRFMALLYICNSVNSVDVAAHFRSGRTFVELFEIERDDTLVDIGVYTLMPNHFHLLVREKIDGGITKFMHKLLTAYSMYFNKKHKRSGALFESKFKAIHAHSDVYLKYLFAYHHLNPVKIIDPKWKKNGISDRESAKQFLSEYTYSSYLDYQGLVRLESNILNRSAFPEYFTKIEVFDSFIDEWLRYADVK